MQKYVASSSQAEMLGQVLDALLQSTNRALFADIVCAHGFDTISPKTWYAYQTVLDFFHELSTRPNSIENLVSIGIKLTETALLPSTVNTIVSALSRLNSIIDMNMRGPVYDQFLVEQVDRRHLRIEDRTALPHDLLYGFLYGIAHRYRRMGENPIVRRRYLNSDHPDADGAIYDITW